MYSRLTIPKDLAKLLYHVDEDNMCLMGIVAKTYRLLYKLFLRLTLLRIVAGDTNLGVFDQNSK